MLRHIVCFKMDTAENAEKAVCLLKSMQGKVPMLRALEVGRDFLGSARSYDVFLGVTLDDRAALDAYQRDPYHCGTVKTFMHAHALSSVSVDFMLD